MVEDGVSGVLVDPRSSEAIGNAIVGLLRDPSRRERLAAAARDRVLKRFAADVVVPLNLEFYAACLASHRQHA